MSEQTPAPTLAPTTSPLAEADPDSINLLIKQRVSEIFNTRPLLLSDEDLRIAIGYYRRERVRFQQESAVKANAPPKARKKTPTSVAEALISADDLL